MITKRQEIENTIAGHDCCEHCRKQVELLREYQASLPPDREPWQIQFELEVSVGRLTKQDESAYYLGWHTGRDAEKQEGSK